MSVTSAASTRLAAPSGGIDAMPTDPSAERPRAGFELLLADAQGPEADASNPSDSSRAEQGTSTSDTKASESKDSSASPAPAPKPASDTDTTGLAGALAATPPPVAPADTAPTDTTAAGPIIDVTTAPSTAPTVLDLVTAAITASDSGPAEASPTDPQTAPTVETDLSALLEPTPRDTGAPLPALQHPPSAPPPTIPTPSAIAPTNSSPAPASATAADTSGRPPMVDSAGPPPSDRPRAQAQSSTSPSSAATFAAPVSAAASAPQGSDEWAAATATVAPPPPAEQLVSVLTPLRTTPNGTYTLRLELKPPEMGRVEMRVEMRDGVLHASIHTEREAAAQLVRDSLGELRDRLNAEGVRTGDLSVSDGGVGPGTHDGEDTPAPGSRSSGPSTTTSEDPAPFAGAPTASSPDSTSLLDVRV